MLTRLHQVLSQKMNRSPLRGVSTEKGLNRTDSPKAGRRVGWSEGLWDYTEGLKLRAYIVGLPVGLYCGFKLEMVATTFLFCFSNSTFLLNIKLKA